MKNSEMPASPITNSDGFPTYGTNILREEAGGLTKLEYASIHIAAVMTVHTEDRRDDQVFAREAVSLAKAVLKELNQ